MSEKKHFNNLENQIFTNYRQIRAAVKFSKFSLVLIFGAIVLLSAADIARAAAFTVDRTDDANGSTCTATANDCTLRGAVALANGSGEDDFIFFDSDVFSSPQTITLTNGELSVANNGALTIFGRANNSVTIDGNLQSRVFSIQSLATVTINNLTITRGRSSNSPNGGGIRNLGTLTINSSEISGNSVLFGNGGGIYNEASLTLTNSTVKNNSAFTSGGGIFNDFGIVHLFSSTINNNVSGTDGGFGGGIGDVGGLMTIRNSTIYGNFGNNGGGIGTGGISLSIYNSTISNNRANPSFGVGGGILGNGVVNLRNSIIADNFAPNAPDFAGFINSLGYNLIRNTNGTTIEGTTTGNILGQNPLLDPAGLKFNGGLTQTVALGVGSPAIDAADPNNFPANDQRGSSRPVDGDNNGSALPDIGAFELEKRLIVTKTADTNDGVCNADCSLREAIAAANLDSNNNVIVFSPSVFNTAQTIVLTNGRLDVMNSGSLRIDGSGTDLLEISGNNQSSIFNIISIANVTINDLTISDGNSAIGGGIYTGGSLTLNRVIVTRCQASSGGGIYVNGNFPVEINFSTISGNSAINGSSGGGIGGSFTSSLTINNSTVVNNSAALGGGVQLDTGTIFVNNSLIRNNTATDNGGGIHLSQSGRVISTNSTITFNTAMNEGGGIRANGSVELYNSNVNNNSASNGGGIFSFGLLTMKSSTVERNHGNFGGGISLYGAGFSGIDGSTISNNSATDGAGGIFNNGVGLELSNSTVSGNSAGQDGGGINNFTVLRLINATIANNTATTGGGIINVPGTVIARNTIIADNSSDDFFGTVNSDGYNLIENTTNTTITSTTSGIIITGQDPQLMPLGNYGGATKTHALRPTSPAIDKGRLTFNLAAIDQRGLPRPFDFPNIPNAEGGDGSDIGAFERQANDVNARTPFDFDGDGRADVSVFRPSEGNWYIQQSTNGFKGATWGLGTDTIVPGDYDGDGKTDLAVFRKSDNSSWYVLRSSDNTFQSVQWGATNQQQGIVFDTPVPADYDGDGKTDFAVFTYTDHLSEPTRFSVLRSSDNTSFSIQWGSFGDRPVPADYDGDGKADIAVNRGGFWYILRSSDNQFFSVQFGTAQDKLVPADYDGDGKADIAVFRTSNGSWYRLNSSNGAFFGVAFGQNDDIPVPADYDGDGKADIAVFRTSNGAWYRLNSSNGSFAGQLFGFGTDKPIPAAFQ